MLSHAFSALEEAQVKRRLSYLIIAVLLTVLDGAVTVYYSTTIWAAWAGDLPARGLLVFFAALEATSLANVWAQVVPALNEPPCGRRGDREQTAAGIQVDARGQADV